MSSDSNTPSDVRFSGSFDEQAFRSYVELHLMPHDKKSGWWIMVLTGAWEELKPWILAQAWKDGFPGMGKTGGIVAKLGNLIEKRPRKYDSKRG